MILVDNLPIVPTEDVRKFLLMILIPLQASWKKAKSSMAQEEEMVRVGALNAVQGKSLFR